MDDVRAASAQRDLLMVTAARIAAYRERVDGLAVFPTFDAAEIVARLGEIPDPPMPAADVVAELAAAVEPALLASAGPRYFGFVIGGSLDAAVAADMLAVGWDQCAFNVSPAPTACRSTRTNSSNATATEPRPPAC